MWERKAAEINSNRLNLAEALANLQKAEKECNKRLMAITLLRQDVMTLGNNADASSEEVKDLYNKCQKV